MNSFMTEIETIFQKSSIDNFWHLEDTIKLPNRAMSYGDGLFETMIWEIDHIRFLDKHLLRLIGGMKILGLDDSAIDRQELITLLEKNASDKKKRIRWSVFRAGSGKYSPESKEVTQILEISEFCAAPSIKYKVDVSEKVRLFPTDWCSFKSLNSLPYVLSNQERKERGLDEIILLDYRGFISEAGASSVFWIKDGVVYTPSLTCSCINGISRQVILENLHRSSVPFVEGEFILSELIDAEQLFVSNCTGISYLQSFGEKSYSTQEPWFLKQLFD